MSAAVGPGLTIVGFPSSAGRVRLTRGFPSTVFTVVGSYCSSLVSQGGSSCARSITIGAYVLASWSEGLSAARAGAAVTHTAAAKARTVANRSGRRFTARPYQTIGRPILRRGSAPWTAGRSATVESGSLPSLSSMAEFAIRVPSVDELLDAYSVEPLERRPLRDDVRDRILRAWIDTREERPSHLTVELPANERRAGLDADLKEAIRQDLSRTYQASKRLHVFTRGERREAEVAFMFLV